VILFNKALALSSTPVEISHIRQEKIVRKFKIWKILSVVFALASLFAGCNQNRKQNLPPPLPTVIATSPADGAKGVVTNTTVRADFSSVMNPSTINAATFTLKGPGGTLVAGAVSYAGTSAIFTPTVSLAANTLYLATITTGAQNPGGIALATNFVWSFTTAPPPTVISTIPANGAIAVAVNTAISAAFSEAMNPATINAATFTLTGPGATSVAGTVTYAGTSVTFTPTATLATGTLYMATITTGAKDPTGAALAANFVWTFTTAASPTVISTVPVNGALAAPVNTAISATFSRAMNPVTINATSFTLSGPGSTPVAGTVTYAGVTATFTPSAVLATGASYTATITTGAKDLTGAPLAANFVWTFTAAVPPTVVSTIPANGATAVAVNTAISATFSQAMDAATITAATFTLAGPGATPVAGTVTYSGSTATFTPTAILATGTLYMVTITTGAKDPAGAPLATNFVWTFTTVAAPTVVSTVPLNGATAAAVNTAISATFSKAMNPATINAATFTLTGPGATPVAGSVTYAGNTATFTPTTVLPNNTVFSARVTTGAQDLAGNALAANFAWSFTTAAPPTVVSELPANGATAVAVNAAISATFSEAMNPATINATTFTVTGPGATPVAGAVTYAGTTTTFAPSAALTTSTSFTATITTGAKDSAGAPLGANVVWTFTTAPPATVISTIPADGATGVAVNTALSATFSEPMNPATINAATFVLTGPGATPVAGTVAYAGTTATFTPSAVLSTSTIYTATITTGAKAPSGTALAANFVWTFTTAAPASVVNTAPANGAVAVPANTAVSATFSEAMNPATINAATFTLTGPGATPVAGSVTYAGTTATFTPTAPLAAGTLYTATITTGTKDPGGVGLAANYVWTFATVPSPTIVSTVPVNGAAAVAVNTPISAMFSQAMNPTTISAATFTLTGPGATPVSGTVNYAGITATFTPTAVLTTSTVYTATITTGAKNPAGVALAANFVWTFTTAPPATVVSTIPVNGAPAVAVNTAISAMFSDAMNPATINAATFTLTGPGATPVAGVVAYSGTIATFTPSALLAAGTLFTATITTGAKDSAGAALAANFAWTFTTAVPPTVVSTIPANGATAVAVNAPISATFSRAMDPATITSATFTLTGPGTTPVAGTVGYTGSVATFTPTTVLTTSTLYTATITNGAKDPTGASLAANFVWTFTTAAPPTVVSTIPINGATAAAVNTAISVTFSRAMNPATINEATFTLAGPGATPVVGVVAYSGTIGTFAPSAILATGTLYTATITTGAKDPTGAPLAANFTWTFTTAVPPTVVSTIPANAATSVAVNTAISATFSQAMDPATITSATFTVTGPGATPVPGTVTYAGTTGTFTPTTVLTTSTFYMATITTGAKDPSGAALAASFVWTFTTAAPPTVVSTIPANGATAVAVSTAISATFSEAMDPATITATTFTLTGPGATPVGGTVSYSGGIATFTPIALLATGVSFTATITTGAKDPAGVGLTANSVWTFATASAPKISFTTPAGGRTNVPLNQKIAATFNTPMNSSTITAPGTLALNVTTGGAAVPGAVTYDAASNTAILAPTGALAAGTQYTATVTTAAQSVPGIALPTNYVWSFITGIGVNAGAPRVTSTIPASAALNVPINQKIAATFSDAMDPATISAPGTFTIAETNSETDVPGAIAYDAASNTAVFTPVSGLSVNTEFTATITTGAANLTGIAMGANFVWSFTTGSTAEAVAPTITGTNPASAVLSVPLNKTINATFSKPMNPVTLTSSTFSLAVAGVGGVPVDGTVSYDPTSQIAIFRPAANLIAGTQYTATISNLVADLFGNALAGGAAPNPWTFTTGSSIGPIVPDLGAAATFGAVGGGAGITNAGTSTVINGDIGTTGVSTSMTGFHDAGAGCTYTETPSNAGFVNGTIDTAPPPPTGACPSEGTAATLAIATQAASDALAAYNDLAGRSGGGDPGAGQLGGLTLASGTYTAAGGAFLITGSDLTLDGQGDANAIWVFQMASSLTVGAPGFPRSVILINGARAKNVFWQVGSAATINAAGGGTMVGTIIAPAGATFSTAGNAAITTLDGRALGLSASVTMVNVVINKPAP
jgi:ketosteroid isomerase-like protein